MTTKFVMTYDVRNRTNLGNLADNTKAAALKWYQYCIDNQIDVLIYETIRTEEQQRQNVASGASKTMKSYHLVGQALDFVKANSDKTVDWNGYGGSGIKKAIAEAKRLGFEWGGDWKDFVDKPHLQYNYKGYGADAFDSTATTSTTSTATTEPTQAVTSGADMTTGSIVEYLNSIGTESSFANRKKLATVNGISNYSGTAAQNTKLLGILRGQGTTSTTVKFFPATSAGNGSVVNALNTIKVDSSFANRKKIASANGISNYTGTAAQNKKMIDLLKVGKLIRV